MQRKLDRMKAVFEAQSILKCPPNASNAEKVKAVNSLKDCYSVRILCDAVNLPTSSYYHYKRREAYRTLYEHNDELIKPLIKEIFENSEYRWANDQSSEFLQNEDTELPKKELHA